MAHKETLRVDRSVSPLSTCAIATLAVEGAGPAIVPALAQGSSDLVTTCNCPYKATINGLSSINKAMQGDHKFG